VGETELADVAFGSRPRAIGGSDRPIRWGILGTGQVAALFVRGLRHAPGAEPYAVASRSRATARSFADHHGLERSYSPYADLLADDEVDVVYVATPPARHAEDSLACLGAGKAVLCEKPFATSAAEARQVVASAREKGIFCMEAMWMRFLPAMQQAVQLCRSGALGDVRMLAADFGVPTDPSSFRFDASLGGGALLDRAVYPLSLAFDLLGRPIQVSSQLTRAPSGVDENVGIVLHYEGGQVACLGASLTSYLSNEAIVAGTRGRLRIHEPLCRPHRITRTAAPAPAAQGAGSGPGGRLRSALLESRALAGLLGWVPAGAHRSRSSRVHFSGNGYGYEAAEVVECLRNGRIESPRMPLDETLAIMETIDTIRAQSGLLGTSRRSAGRSESHGTG
jgi:predicted dehydrogenase